MCLVVLPYSYLGVFLPFSEKAWPQKTSSSRAGSPSCCSLSIGIGLLAGIHWSSFFSADCSVVGLWKSKEAYVSAGVEGASLPVTCMDFWSSQCWQQLLVKRNFCFFGECLWLLVVWVVAFSCLVQASRSLLRLSKGPVFRASMLKQSISGMIPCQ